VARSTIWPCLRGKGRRKNRGEIDFRQGKKFSAEKKDRTLNDHRDPWRGAGGEA